MLLLNILLDRIVFVSNIVRQPIYQKDSHWLCEILTKFFRFQKFAPKFLLQHFFWKSTVLSYLKSSHQQTSEFRKQSWNNFSIIWVGMQIPLLLSSSVTISKWKFCLFSHYYSQQFLLLSYLEIFLDIVWVRPGSNVQTLLTITPSWCRLAFCIQDHSQLTNLTVMKSGKNTTTETNKVGLHMYTVIKAKTILIYILTEQHVFFERFQ